MDTTRLRERRAGRAHRLDRFYVPAYLGTRGWVGLRLDRGRGDWGEVRELLTDAYRLQAPRKLAALLDQDQAGSSSPR